MSSVPLQEDPSVESVFNDVETETLALFEHLPFEFLEEFDMFVPAETGRTQDLEPPEMMRGFLHCYYKDIYGIRPVTRELNNTVVGLSCGFDRPPLRDAVDRFLADRGFDHLVEQAALGPARLDVLHRFSRRKSDACRSRRIKVYDPTDDEYYYEYGCTIVSTGRDIPIAAEFIGSKQAPEER